MEFHYTDDPVYDAENYDTYMNEQILQDLFNEREELENQLQYETDEDEKSSIKYRLKEMD